ncbi:MAG: aldehyde dehydrogenase [Cyclobacteriaceae bacterium]
MQKISNYINGSLTPPKSGNYIDNYCPATGQVYSLVPDSDDNDVGAAYAAAKAAFGQWSTCGIETRSRVMLKIADLIDANLDKLALAESTDNGKPVKLAKSVDIPRASANFRFFASAIVNWSSEAHITEGQAINYTHRHPIGVVGCISPWNLPLYLFTWKIAPALATGNCVVAKPSELTPMTAFLLSELCTKAGLPKGVLNIVHGLGPKVGEPIVSHPDITAISFTGGTATGKRIAAIAAPMFKKLSLELGGKNPNIIFADCDFEKAVSTSVQSSFANQGEICLCGSRIFIEEGIYDNFKSAFLEKVKKLKVGDPGDSETKLGALVSKAHLEKVEGYVNLAQEEGGTVLHGGQRVEMTGDLKQGYYYEPTVVEGLPSNCRTNQEEIFGPVVTLIPFSNVDAVIEEANSTQYGLSATIWIQDITKAHSVAAKLKSGIVWINCWLFRDLRTPFGGMKQSGVGREGGNEALKFFTEAQNVCVKI